MTDWRRLLFGLACWACTGCSDRLPAPTIAGVTPSQWPQSGGAPVPLTIAGDNFFVDLRPDMISPRAVRVSDAFAASLGVYALTDVRWIDNRTLIASAPANVAPGVYDLEVVTPAGDTASLAAAVEVTATSSQAWWDGQFARRLRVAFDRTPIPEPLIEFPVLVRLDPARIDYGRLQTDGDDLRFVAADGQTILAHEIEAWDPAADSFIWVRVPSIDPTPAVTAIWIYYDNPNVGAAPNAAAVWSAGYRNVWHMADPTPDQTDSASGVVAVAGGPISTESPGRVGHGIVLPGTPPSALTANDGTRNGGTPLSVSAWFNLSAPHLGDWVGIAQKGRQSDTDWHGLWLQPSTIAVGGWSSYAGRGGNLGSTGVNVGTWYHAALSFDGTDATFFVDGVPTGGPSPRYYLDVPGPITIGTDGNGNYLRGLVDEVRFADVTRSAAWIAAQYASMTDTFASYGTVEIRP